MTAYITTLPEAHEMAQWILATILAIAFIAICLRVQATIGNWRNSRKSNNPYSSKPITRYPQDEPICTGCHNSIDLEICWCGSGKQQHGEWTGHMFVPMGCDCTRSR